MLIYFLLLLGGRYDTSKSVILTLSNLWGGGGGATAPSPPARYGPDSATVYVQYSLLLTSNPMYVFQLNCFTKGINLKTTYVSFFYFKKKFLPIYYLLFLVRFEGKPVEVAVGFWILSIDSINVLDMVGAEPNVYKPRRILRSSSSIQLELIH